MGGINRHLYPDGLQLWLLSLCLFELVFFSYYLFTYEIASQNTISDTLFQRAEYVIILTIALAFRGLGVCLYLMRYRYESTGWVYAGFLGLSVALLGWYVVGSSFKPVLKLGGLLGRQGDQTDQVQPSRPARTGQEVTRKVTRYRYFGTGTLRLPRGSRGIGGGGGRGILVFCLSRISRKQKKTLTSSGPAGHGWQRTRTTGIISRGSSCFVLGPRRTRSACFGWRAGGRSTWPRSTWPWRWGCFSRRWGSSWPL